MPLGPVNPLASFLDTHEKATAEKVVPKSIDTMNAFSHPTRLECEVGVVTFLCTRREGLYDNGGDEELLGSKASCEFDVRLSRN